MTGESVSPRQNAEENRFSGYTSCFSKCETDKTEQKMADIKEKELVEDENKIDTVIADDIEFQGNLKFKNSLKIKGTFRGRIETEGQIIIGREASVSADIKAKIVSISGDMNGKITASQRVELFKKSRTGGDIITPDISIEPGSFFNGTCIMEEKK